MVYKNYDGVSVLSRLPNFAGRKWSKAQKANCHRFRDAAAYAQRALEIPEMAAFYESRRKRMQYAWNVAISDFMLNPEICEIKLEKYQGRRGDTIRVTAHDKYQVAAVIVTILNALGLEVESGMAVHMPNGDWVYQAKEENPRWRGGSVVVEVRDVPGNRVVDRRTTSDERRI
jgi:hypothetical protein